MTVPRQGRRAIIVGASSGIGRATAKALAQCGYEVGLCARRADLLESLARELEGRSRVKSLDLAEPENACRLFSELVRDMGGVDLVVLNAGIQRNNFDLETALELETVRINVTGFTALAAESARIFLKQGHGHLVGVSSIAAVRGSLKCPAYGASKSYVSNYLEALYFRLKPFGIHVTDIRPGYVDTSMISGGKMLFWVASCEKAARQIVRAIHAHRKSVYVTRRWAWVAWLYRRIPDRILLWGYRHLDPASRVFLSDDAQERA